MISRNHLHYVRDAYEYWLYYDRFDHLVKLLSTLRDTDFFAGINP